jgi:hypothetical protein
VTVLADKNRIDADAASRANETPFCPTLEEDRIKSNTSI